MAFINRFHCSLRQLYSLIATLLFGVVLVVSLFTIYDDYQEYKENEIHEAKIEAEKIVRLLDMKFSLVNNFLQFHVRKILNSYDYSKENIAYMIHSETQEEYWSEMYFVNPEYHVIANSNAGTTDSPISNYITSKKLFKHSKNNMGRSFFDNKHAKSINGKKRVMMSTSVIDHEYYFLGYLAVAIEEDLVKYISQYMNDKIAFVAFSNDKNFLISSSGIDTSYLPDYFLTENNEKESNGYVLEKPIDIGEYNLLYVAKSNKHPFSAIVGVTDLSYFQNMYDYILPHISRNILTFVLYLSVMAFAIYIIARPVLMLIKYSENILDKDKNIHLPELYIKEFNTLGNHIKNVRNVNLQLSSNSSNLKNANEELEKINQFVSSNIAFLNHELKNPIANIIGFSELILEKIDHYNSKKTTSKKAIDDISQYANIINDSSEYQNNQIDFFLKMFKYREKGKMLENKFVSIKKIVEFNCSMLKYYALKNNVKVEISIDDTIPELIGDEIILDHMVQNFISNGIKYNKNGGSLTIRAFVKRPLQSNKEFTIEFEDTGIGISKDDIKHLFDKFNRIKSEETDGTIGYELGLTYAKSCILCHDGIIDIRSVPDKGSKFTITFPAYRIYNGQYNRRKDEKDK